MDNEIQEFNNAISSTIRIIFKRHITLKYLLQKQRLTFLIIHLTFVTYQLYINTSRPSIRPLSLLLSSSSSFSLFLSVCFPYNYSSHFLCISSLVSYRSHSDLINVQVQMQRLLYFSVYCTLGDLYGKLGSQSSLRRFVGYSTT